MLGIVNADGTYLGVPTKETRIEPGDTAILYGRDGRFAELTARRTGPRGDQAHHQAVARQREVADEEQEQDRDRLGER